MKNIIAEEIAEGKLVGLISAKDKKFLVGGLLRHGLCGERSDIWPITRQGRTTGGNQEKMDQESGNPADLAPQEGQEVEPVVLVDEAGNEVRPPHVPKQQFWGGKFPCHHESQVQRHNCPKWSIYQRIHPTGGRVSQRPQQPPFVARGSVAN